MKPRYRFETQAIREQYPRPEREHSTPLYMTSSFVFDDADHGRAMFADEIEGNIYTRFSNPNTSELVDKMCLLEGAEDGMACASGMSAIFTTFGALLGSGEHILSARSVFGSTHQILTRILPRWGISHTYADMSRPEDWEALIQDNTRMIFLETPSNPGLEIMDLEWLGDLCKKHNLLLVVDNCFATPYLQRPLDWGAHLIIHSLTKLIDGQGRAIGGIVLGAKKEIAEIRFFGRHTGPTLSPFNAWIFSKSLETLAVRVDRHCDNAETLAAMLHDRQDVERTLYPFMESHPQYHLAKKQMKRGGSVVTFIVAGGLERAKRFVDTLEIASLTANLGDTRTIVTHPTTTTHSKLTEDERQAVGIYPGLVRISLGLEHIDDIVDDVTQALDATR